MSAPRGVLERAFEQARAELEVRTAYAPEALAEAEAAARRSPRAPAQDDATAIPFLTIDPPGSRDLDQALHIERAAGGYRVRYAIADVGHWVDRGGALEAEAWRRGVTIYAPDRREPLYPEALSAGAASLLPEQETPAVLFTLELDARGALGHFSVRRARVRSRAQLTYGEVQAQVREGGDAFPGEEWGETLSLLAEVGRLRLQREAERGGVSLPIPEQRVQQDTAARLGYEVVYDESCEAEEWNAQISLLAGHAAALRMLGAGVGLLRTLAPPDPADLARFRLAARALGFHWPWEAPYADFIRTLPLGHPHLPPLVWQARRLMRGAGYAAFSGEPPEQPLHAALAMPYAHCTAPLRRLADRYVLELLLALEAGSTPSAAEVETLQRLPAIMQETGRRAGLLERRVVDLAEAATLAGRVGQRFDAVVLDAQPERLEVQLAEPPVRTMVPLRAGTAPPQLGQQLQVRLAAVEVAAGRVALELAEG